jgi:hypothetical protein
VTARLETSTPRTEAVARLVEIAADAAVASRIAAGGVGAASLWPGLARPGWITALRSARPLVGEIAALREQRRVAGQVRVLLAAADGVGVAAEALTGGDPRLVVLDTTDPAQVADALAGDLAATVLVVSAPPGADTTAVELLRDAAHRAMRAEGLDPAAHTIVVSAPGGPLQEQADGGNGTVVVPGLGDVDGPWAAFTAFALVPAGLAGADVGVLLADAAEAREALAADDTENPALELGALLAERSLPERADSTERSLPERADRTEAPVLALAAADDPVLAEWVAQLVAAGLGKAGRGPLPVLVEGDTAPEWSRPDTLTAGIGPVPGAAVATLGSPAVQMLHWQHAVAVAAHLLGVDPTDRPDVPAATGAGGADEPPVFCEGGVEVRGGTWLPADTTTVADALRALVAAGAEDRSYLVVHAYLDRQDDASAAVLRAELARRTGLPTTFGWAPRCLPGSGQYAAGGPVGGLVCQITGDVDPDLGDPDEPAAELVAALAELQRSQARAEAAALAARGRPVLRLHFTDRVAGLVTVARAVQRL